MREGIKNTATIDDEMKLKVTEILRSLGDEPKILDIGCGTKKRGNIGLDLYPFEGVDIVWDIKEGLPFSDNVFDGVYIYHVLEHLPMENFERLLYEIWRCSKNKAWIRVKVPHYSGPNAWSDPTHIRPFSLSTFSLYLTIDDQMHYNFDRHFRVELKDIRLNWHSFPEDETKRPISFLLRDAIEFFANMNSFMQRWCERLWCYWIGGFGEIDATLIVEKD